MSKKRDKERRAKEALVPKPLKVIQERTLEQRLNQVVVIRKRLEEVKFDSKLSGIKELTEKMNDFIYGGKEFNGVIVFTELPVKLDVHLVLNTTLNCSVHIKN